MQLITACGNTAREGVQNMHHWFEWTKTATERSGPSWIMSSLRQPFISGIVDSCRSVKRVLYTFSCNISHTLLYQLYSNLTNLQATVDNFKNFFRGVFTPVTPLLGLRPGGTKAITIAFLWWCLCTRKLGLIICCRVLLSYILKRSRRCFPVVLGPIADTFADFWRMIWEQNSDRIAMVTNLEEGGKVNLTACHCQIGLRWLWDIL